MKGWGNCLKYLRRRWNRKEGREKKDFKKGEEAGSRGKKGEGWNPLINYGFSINYGLNFKSLSGLVVSNVLQSKF